MSVRPAPPLSSRRRALRRLAAAAGTAVAAAVLAAACSQTPVPSTYGLSWQDKMQSVHHWDILAEDLAEDIDAFMAATPAVTGLPVHVARRADARAFGRLFHDLLESRLFARGLAVSRTADRSLEVQYDVLGVEHGTEGRDAGTPPGLFSLIGGVAALGRADLSDATLAGWYGGGGLVADLLSGSVALRTRTEALFLASVYDGDILLYRMARLYYVPEGDAPLYAAFEEEEETPPSFVLRQGAEGPLDLLGTAEARCRDSGRIALLRKVERDAAGTALAFSCVDDVISAAAAR